MRNLQSMLVLALLLAAMPADAQEPAAVRRIVLPSLDSQVAARLIELDRRLNSAWSSECAAAVVSQLACAGTPFDVLAPIVADPGRRELWDELADDYYRLAQESGEVLVTIPDTSPIGGSAWSSGQVRSQCHQRLAILPRTSLAIYRQRVDAEARTLFDQGRQTRSPVPLRRIVDDLFCSTPGDQALDLLGDLAFERGRFAEARHWWSLLTPLDRIGDGRLLFPAPQVDLVRVEAKQILSMIFDRRLDEAGAELSRFAGRHPRAEGQLAGQDGRYVAILRKTLDAFRTDRKGNDDEPWTTFGGGVCRNRLLTHELPRQLWEDGPAWRVKLPVLDAADKSPRASPGYLRRRAAFHPVIVNNQVLLADHRSVVSYHLTTGKELFRYDLKNAGLLELDVGFDARIGRPCFTLSVDHERAYVRLGRPGLGPNTNGVSFLVCLDLTHPEIDKQRELWHVRAGADDQSALHLEGSPLAYDGRVFMAQTKDVGRRLVTSIVCYDALGRQRWTREVCDCPEFEGTGDETRYRQHLLTWAGGQIVYASHAGAIVAVDAWTGQPTWGVRYPSRGPRTPEGLPSPRDLTPCVYADGRVFVAPLDTDRVFCLDAITGRVHWEAEGLEVVHLLGVAQGRLMATTQTGAVSIDAATGQTSWLQPSEGRLASLGRGLLAGDTLVWPTQDVRLPYRVLATSSGQQRADPAMLHTLPPGNLAFGQGCLAVASIDELVVYVPAHKLKDLPPGERPEARLRFKHIPLFTGR